MSAFNRPGVSDDFLACTGCHHVGGDEAISLYGCQAEGIAIPFRQLNKAPLLDKEKNSLASGSIRQLNRKSITSASEARHISTFRRTSRTCREARLCTHLVDLVSNGNDCACYVFKKTDFVKQRLAIMVREVEEQSDAEEAEKLKKSNYSTFIYIMQDMRNGIFKIGRSITPGKRERTLQSEIPEIVLRFSIPADEIHEKHLHDYFEAKKLRGEWFALEPSELLWVVLYLKKHGDIERLSVNFEWLGQIFVLAKT